MGFQDLGQTDESFYSARGHTGAGGHRTVNLSTASEHLDRLAFLPRPSVLGDSLSLESPI